MVRQALVRESRAPLRILEVGAGVGPVSSVLAARMLPGDTLDIVELDEGFCATLREVVGRLPGVRVHHGDVLAHVTSTPYDRIVSGLPLANFPHDQVRAIYAHLFDSLSDRGLLVNFQHLLLRQLIGRFATAAHRERARALLRLENALKPTLVRRVPVPRNVPPAEVLVRRRPAGGVGALLSRA
jgi:phosphatidylethanolamine/phosphatidyl-N-methylethanolamine N-methyltransferase